MLINQGGHMAAVNSLAREMAGVNAGTRIRAMVGSSGKPAVSRAVW